MVVFWAAPVPVLAMVTVVPVPSPQTLVRQSVGIDVIVEKVAARGHPARGIAGAAARTDAGGGIPVGAVGAGDGEGRASVDVGAQRVDVAERHCARRNGAVGGDGGIDVERRARRRCESRRRRDKRGEQDAGAQAGRSHANHFWSPIPLGSPPASGPASGQFPERLTKSSTRSAENDVKDLKRRKRARRADPRIAAFCHCFSKLW